MFSFKLSVITALLSTQSIVSANDNENVFLRGLQDDTPPCPPVDTVSDFDLEQFVSKPWYIHQQAVTEFSPTSQNYCVRARYSIRETPTFWGYTVDVDNYAQDVNGTEFGGPLCAAQEDDDTASSKLKVAPCFLPKLAAGPYWIVAYEDESDDEGYALISGGQPTIRTENGCKSGDGINNSGLWIFSRSTIRNDTMIEHVREIASNKGFDLTILNDVQQEGCVYPEDENEKGVDEDEDEEEEEEPPCETDSEETFGTVFSGQKDCQWVGEWATIRCIFHSSKCPETCGNSNCDNV